MKALPLWQPWASLVAVGAKRVETRSWPAPSYLVGQRLAIHATRTLEHVGLCSEEPFSRYVPDPGELPLGAVIATVRLARCARITEGTAAELERRNPHEFAFGDYTPGRYAWVLEDVRRLLDPIHGQGRQGIFDVPDNLFPAVALAPGPGVVPTAEQLTLEGATS